MATRLLPPGYQEFDANGDVAAGAKLYTYGAGTSTPKTTYSDSALTVANANPVVADGSGRFGDVFAGVGSYRLVMTKSDGSTLWTADPVDGASTSGGSGGTSTGNLLRNGDFRLGQWSYTFAVNVADAQYAADGWYALQQSNPVSYSQLTAPEDGQVNAARLTQSNVTAQRMGLIQFIPGADCQQLRNAAAVVAGRIRCSLSQAVRYAILGWTGTTDVPTLDVVNDWTSGSYTPGGFFISANMTVVAVGSVTPAANVWTDLPDLSGSLSGSVTNLAVMVWMEGTVPQNATLDMGLLRLNAGSTSQSFDRRALGFEKLLTTPDPDLNVRTNLLNNGGLEVWQRGSSVAIAASTTATASVYTADCWCMETSASQNMTVSRQAGMVDQSQYCVQVQRDAGQTGTSTLRFQHPLELETIVRMRGKPVSVSFLWAPQANFSGTMSVKLYCGTGTEGRRTNAAAYTTETTPLNQSVPATTGGFGSYQFTSSVVVPTTTTQASLVFEWTPSGTAGAADAFKLDNVQMNVGQPMLYVHRPYSDDLRYCQRWFQLTEAAITIQGVTDTASRIYSMLYVMPVRMRATPTIGATFTGATNCTGSITNPSAMHFQISATSTTGGGVGMSISYSSGNTIDARL